jgi:hypothetical protein
MNTYKQLVEQKLNHIKKYERNTNFHIFIEDELYGSYPDKFQRDRHFNTKKFEKILGERKVYFYDGKIEDLRKSKENNNDDEKNNII